jgi:hypothetical protein
MEQPDADAKMALDTSHKTLAAREIAQREAVKEKKPDLVLALKPPVMRTVKLGLAN